MFYVVCFNRSPGWPQSEFTRRPTEIRKFLFNHELKITKHAAKRRSQTTSGPGLRDPDPGSGRPLQSDGCQLFVAPYQMVVMVSAWGQTLLHCLFLCLLTPSLLSALSVGNRQLSVPGDGGKLWCLAVCSALGGGAVISSGGLYCWEVCMTRHSFEGSSNCCFNL